MTEPLHATAVSFFEELPITLVADTAVARTKMDIDSQVDALGAAGVEVLVAHIPCWTSPN
ncbi:MAG: hypothetical protein GTO53_12100, partial [Planctomycetales bacterium]|nr:hypothetical protein [Planctomycetales bacterium]NIN78400.1 hypothetical protein [Planctomycetales bacterium]NIP70824.1 hypothetical protein [Planctomycetales bacterium]